MSIVTIIYGTPIWVWFALALVVYLGIGRTRDRIVSVQRLLLFPLLVVGLAVSNLAASVGSTASLVGFALGAAGGMVVGLALERRNAAARLENGKRTAARLRVAYA